MRTAGSAKLWSAATHECAIAGHGHEARPHDVSDVLGCFQVTVYGVVGPVMAATRISLAGAVLSDLIRATNSATGINMPSHSDEVQFCSITWAATSPLGASRPGRTPLQTCPNSLQRKFEGGPSTDATFTLESVS